MSVAGLEEVGRFLVGDGLETQPGWLQAVHTSATPQGDFLCMAKTQSMVLLRSSWTAGKLELKETCKQSIAVLQEEEEVTCCLVFPVQNGGKLKSVWHCTALGFNTGIVRFYNESGQLVIQRPFSSAPVKQIKFQSMPEGKHCTNILFTQSALELLVVYPSMVVCVAANDLLSTLTSNTEELAKSMAHGLETSQLSSIQAHRLLIREQEVADCDSFVYTNTSYRQYYQLTMQGGFVDDRHRPVATQPYFLTVGQEPFLQYNEKGGNPTMASPTDLAHTMVSTVKSGFFRVASGALGSIWSGGAGAGAGQEEKEGGEGRRDPESKLNISHSLKDSGRQGLEVAISPNKLYSAIRDSQNRVMLVDNLSKMVVQMWRGYHRCQVGWGVASANKISKEAEHLSPDIALVLIIYLPRRGLIEVWSPEQKNKVTEFHVSKHGTLLRSAGSCLDDGLPRRRETVRLYTAFLHPTGKISHFHIPFHAISTSSSAERDIQVQENITQLLEAEHGPDFAERLASLLEAVKNLQLKNFLITALLTREEGGTRLGGGEGGLTAEEAASLVGALLARCCGWEEKGVSLEHKLYRSKLTKLQQLILFYQKLVRVNLPQAKPFPSNKENVIGDICCSLGVEEEEAQQLLHMLEQLSENSNTTAVVGQQLSLDSNMTAAGEQHQPQLLLSEFLLCFELEGEITPPIPRSKETAVSSQPTAASATIVPVRMKKAVLPTVQSLLSRLLSGLCSDGEAVKLVADCGLSPVELFEAVMTASLRDLGSGEVGSLTYLARLQTCLTTLLANPGADDKVVSVVQDLCKRVLVKLPTSPQLFVFMFVLRNASQAAGCPFFFVGEWDRRLVQAHCFLDILNTYTRLARDLTSDKAAPAPPRYSLSDIFDGGNGRIAELVAKWLRRLGSSSTSLASSLYMVEEAGEEEGPADEEQEENRRPPEQVLVAKVAEYYPKSMDTDILLLHLVWEEFQLWQRNRDNIELGSKAIASLSHVSCHLLRLKFSYLLWRTFFAKLFRDVARKTEDFKKFTVNESLVCERELGMQRDNIGDWLKVALSLLDRMLDLTRMAEFPEMTSEYEEENMDRKHLHLLDHVKGTQPPESELLSLEQQVASVLSLTWSLRLPSRPLRLFTSMEIRNLLNTQASSSSMSSWLSDYNAGVKRERVQWVEVVCEAVAGHIHCIPGDKGFDTAEYKQLMEQLHQLAKVWLMSETVKIRQCEAVYKAGHDPIAAEIKGLISESSELSERLLEVGLLRLTKHLYHVSDVGRMAAVPPDIITELAARRGPAASVAEVALADTLSLLLWTSEHLTAEESQHLCTQAISAVQVLQVRKSRLNDG